jgi:hypothetical protein
MKTLVSFLIFLATGAAFSQDSPGTILQSGIQPRPHYDDHRFFSVSQDHRLALLGCGPDLWVYDLAARKLIHRHTTSGGYNFGAVLDPSGRYILCHRNLGHGLEVFVVHDIATGREIVEDGFEPASLKTGNSAFHFDHKGVRCEVDGRRTGQVDFRKWGAEEPELALGAQGQFLKWDRYNQFSFRQGEFVVDSFSIHGIPGLEAAKSSGAHFLEDGRLIAYGIAGGEFLAVDVFNDREILRRKADRFFLNPASNRLALHQDGQIEIVELLSGDSVARFRGEPPFLLSPDGACLATWVPDKAKIFHFEIASSKSAFVDWPAEGPVSLSYNSDASELVVAGSHVSDNQVLKMRTSDGTVMQRYEGFMAPVAFREEEDRFYGTQFDSHCSMAVSPLDENRLSGIFGITPNSYQMSGLSFGPGEPNFYVVDSWRDLGSYLTKYDFSSGEIQERWSISGRFHGPVMESADLAMVSQSDGGLFFFDPSEPENPSKQVQFYLFSDGTYAAVNRAGEYFAPPGLIDMLGFTMGTRGFSFEQFDLLLNRPAKVFAFLGAPPAMISGLTAWREERLRNMNLDPGTGFDLSRLPRCRIREKEALPFNTPERLLSLSLEASGEPGPERWQIYINNVPVLSKTFGVPVSDFSVQLSGGRNKLEVSVIGKDGLESVRDVHYVTYIPDTPEKPELYLLAVGVSDYADDELELDVADKDAEDMAAAIAEKAAGSFGTVHIRKLVNTDATRENIVAVAEFLRQSRVDDQVIVFFAGHGFQDPDDFSYWFGTHDIDWENPRGRGLGYDVMERFFEGIAARQRLLLLDTCFAGEVYSDELLEAVEGNLSFGLAEGSVRAKVPKIAISRKRSADSAGTDRRGFLGPEWFTDLRRQSGATVLTATGGVEFVFALETEELGNGVFTHCFLKKLMDNPEGVVRTSEMDAFLKEEVALLTEGDQVPSRRTVNLELDFAIASTNSMNRIPATFPKSSFLPAPGIWQIVETLSAKNGGNEITWNYRMFPGDQQNRFTGFGTKVSVDGTPARPGEKAALGFLEMDSGANGQFSGTIWESNGRGRLFPVAFQGTLEAGGRKLHMDAYDLNTGEFSAGFSGALVTSAPVEAAPSILPGPWTVREIVLPENGSWDIQWSYRLDSTDSGGLTGTGRKVLVNGKEATSGEKKALSMISLERDGASRVVRGLVEERNSAGRVFRSRLEGAIGLEGSSFLLKGIDPEKGEVTALFLGVRD